jgi:hypothetical protein
MKLRAIVGEHLGQQVPAVDGPGFPPGAGVMVGDEAWVLIDDLATGRPANRLGSALAWALRRRASSLHLVTEADEGVLARRAGLFEFPVNVWRAADRRVIAAQPVPLPTPASAPTSHLVLRELIFAGGASPVVEHGVVSGEVRGLEVCRVVDDLVDGAVDATGDSTGARLEIGVGVHDREAFQMLHGDTPTVESLARVVDTVRQHRAPGAARHPFNAMAAERLLRWRVEDSPGLLDGSLVAGPGLASVWAAQPPLPRSSAVEVVPCVAHGTDRDGRPVVLVFSSGVDLDVVPYAADARLAARDRAEAAGTGSESIEQRLVVVTPARDRLPITAELAGLLRQSLELASIA